MKREPHFRTSGSTGQPEFDQRVRALVEDWGGSAPPELVTEMMFTALRLAKDPISTGDFKLFNRVLKELRTAAKVFEPYRECRKVSVFGSARTSPDADEFKVAEEFGRRMHEEGFMIVTGGGDGIMGAAQRGAGRENSFGLNIRLPFEQRANETIDGDSKLINFNYFFTRKLNFIKESHAIALFPGGFGTMDEGFEALTLMQTGKAKIIPLVLVDKHDGKYWETWFEFLCDYLLKLGLISADDFNLFKVTHDVEEAVREVVNFYRIYHSWRWVGDRLVMRLSKTLKSHEVARLNIEFGALLRSGTIEQGVALPEEANEENLRELPRLLLHPHRHMFGKLRRLIDRINLCETV